MRGGGEGRERREAVFYSESDKNIVNRGILVIGGAFLSSILENQTCSAGAVVCVVVLSGFLTVFICLFGHF